MKRIGIQRNHGSTWHKALAILSVSVALCTLYILMLPAIAMEAGPDPATPETAAVQPDPATPETAVAQPAPSGEPEVPAAATPESAQSPATAESAQGPATPESAVPQTFSLTGQTTDGITVTVCGAADSLPCPAEEITVQVQEVTDESVRACWEQILSEGDTAPDQQFLLDITLLQNGQEIQPTGPVTVTFTGLDTEGGAAELYHISDDAETVTDLESQQEENGEISLETDHFSVYAARVLAETNGTGLSDFIGGQLSGGGDFYLTGDAHTEQDGNRANLTIRSNTTIDLNGHVLYISKQSQCFTVENGATLTIKDSGAQEPTSADVENPEHLYSNLATLQWNTGDPKDNKPISLTYFVTESSVGEDGITTKEQLKQYRLTGGGCIVGSDPNGTACIVKVNSGGTLNLKGGLLTIKNSENYQLDSHIINNSGTLNLEGGYVAGAKENCWGGGIYSGEGSTVNMTGGVIAANHGKNGGGLCIVDGTFNMSGGVISGNEAYGATLSDFNAGYGGGVYGRGNNVEIEISGGSITNNSESGFCTKEGVGGHGGGGLAIIGGKLTVNGGFITGNSSAEAGGGLYVGHYNSGEINIGGTTFTMSGGTVASNYTENSEGGGIRISGNTQGTIRASEGNKIYITNNRTNSDYDWGGGGIFVQAQGNLNIENSLITQNSAGGYGGGVGACPTGETLLLNDMGAAVYGNSAEGKNMSDKKNEKPYDREVAQASDEFNKGGYADYFCVREETNTTVVSLVTGEMVGGGAANWTGSCDRQPITISKTGYAAAKYLFGLTASPDDDAKDAAKAAAGVIISGNSAYTHGGGIMTNGGLILGKKETDEDGNEDGNVTTSPALEIKGTKAFTVDGVEASNGKNFNFVLKKDNGEVVGTATADAQTGDFTISPNTNYEAAGTYTYTLSEINNGKFGVTYDPSVYTIMVTIRKDSVTILGVTFTSYSVASVTVNKEGQPEGHPGTFQVHFKNESNWNQVNMYIWDENNQGQDTPLHQYVEWPGFSVDPDEQHNDWYTHVFPVTQSGTFSFKFSNNGASETGNFEGKPYAPGQDLWVYNGTCSQGAPSDWDEGSNVGFTETKNPDESYTITFNEAAFTNSKITPLTLKLIKPAHYRNLHRSCQRKGGGGYLRELRQAGVQQQPGKQ